jgi:Cu2+-exporting ATPase
MQYMNHTEHLEQHWATAYNIIALPLAAGILYYQGVVITPALGAVLMSMSTIIVSINARLLKIK